MKPATQHRRGKEVPPLEWVADAALQRLTVSVIGSERAMVENHQGVIEFSPECVRLRARGGCVRLEGEQLQLFEVRQGALIVRGKIRTIGLPAEADHA